MKKTRMKASTKYRLICQHTSDVYFWNDQRKALRMIEKIVDAQIAYRRKEYHSFHKKADTILYQLKVC